MTYQTCAGQLFQHTSSSGIISTWTITSQKDVSLDDGNGSGFELEKEAVRKGQASGKTTSAVDLLEILPVLLRIIIGGYGLSLHFRKF